METGQVHVTTAMHGNAPPLTWADYDHPLLHVPPVPPAVPLRVSVRGLMYLLVHRGSSSDLDRLRGLPVVIDFDLPVVIEWEAYQ